MAIQKNTSIPEVQQTIVTLRKLNADEKERQVAFYREKRLHDEASALGSARREGFIIGYVEAFVKTHIKFHSSNIEEIHAFITAFGLCRLCHRKLCVRVTQQIASDIITIAILGSICGLRNVHQIHQWAASDKVSKFLKEKFGISHVPCYYWILRLLQLIKPESLNSCFADWVYSFMPKKSRDITISLDGKTVCSTLKMEKIESPLHIISAQVCELGLTLAQRCTDDKSNGIRASERT